MQNLLNSDARRRSISVGEASLGFHYRIDSRMNNTVVVKTRAGINYRLPTPVNHTSRNQHILVKYEVTLSNDVLFYLVSELGSTEVNRNLIRMILDACDNVRPGCWLGSGKSIALDLKITREMLENAGGSLYIDFLDMELTIDPSEFDTPHRDSVAGVKNKLLGQIIDAHAEKAVYKGVVLVDSQSRIDRRFISLNNEVIELVPSKASQAYPQDGCYFIDVRPGLTKNEQITFITMDVLLEDEGDTFGLYRSYEAAMAKGNTRLLREQEKRLTESEQRNNEMSQTLNEERRKHERRVDDITDKHRKEMQTKDDKIAELNLKLTHEQLSKRTQKETEQLKQENERNKELLSELTSIRANCDKENTKVMRSLLGGPGAFLKQCVGLLHTLL